MKFSQLLAILLSIFSIFISGVCPAAEVFLPGEKIEYDIKKVFSVGKASLTFNGPAEINRQKAVLITFRAEGLNFYDEEKIYLDPVELYPLVVERDLDIWGKKEKISELYDQKLGLVTITKMVDGKRSEKNIHKDGKIDNIYAFLYRYRRSGSFKEKDRLKLKLPTKDVVIVLKKKVSLEAAGNEYQAYFMESEPKEYSLWFDTGLSKLPLRIDGALGMGKTKMIMKSHTPGSR